MSTFGGKAECDDAISSKQLLVRAPSGSGSKGGYIGHSDRFLSGQQSGCPL
jgi:hypothetical protein